MRQSTIGILCGWVFLALSYLDGGNVIFTSVAIMHFVLAIVFWCLELARDVAEQSRRADALLKESRR